MELKGLNSNPYKDLVPSGSWLDARNIVIEKDNSVTTENGFIELLSLSPNDVVIGKAEQSTKFYYFIVNTVTGISSIIEINIPLNTPIVDTIISSQYLNFNVNHPILAKVTANYKNETILIWTDNYNPVRFLNADVDEVGLSPSKEFLNPSNVDLLLHYVAFDSGKIDLLDVEDTGGNLESGIYQVAFKYLTFDGIESNVVDISPPIHIEKSLLSDSTFSYTGCEPSTITSKQIKLQLSRLDLKYKKVAIYLFYTSNGITKSCLYSNVKIPNPDYQFVISDLSLVDFSTLNEILVPSISISKANCLTLYQANVVYGNVSTFQESNFQSVANNTKIKWIKEDVTITNIEKAISLTTNHHSYKDNKKTFYLKSFKAGEVYAFYIAFKFKDGNYSSAYHIPGNDLEIGDNDVITLDTVKKLSSNPVNKYQVFDTSKSDGTMGKFINKNEFYDTNLGLTGNVRHHRFPDINTLQGYGHKFLNTLYGGSYNNRFIFSPSYTSGSYSVTATNSNNTVGTTTYVTFDNRLYMIYTAIQSQWINLESRAALNITNNTTDQESQIHIFKFKNRVGDQFLNKDNLDSFFGYDKVILTDVISTVKLEPTECLCIAVDINPNISTVTLTGSFTGSCHVGVQNPEMTYAVPLGIEVSNVFIPNTLKKDIIGWEIFYAKRNAANSTIAAQDVIKDYRSLHNSYNNAYNRAYSFDLLTFKPLNPDYIKSELYIGFSNASSNTNYLKPTIVENPAYYQNYTTAVSKITDGEYVSANTFRDVFFINSNDTSNHFSFKQSDSIAKLGSDDKDFYLVNFCYLKEDCYFDFSQQELISTGICVDKDLSVSKIYGGDTYICYQGIVSGELDADWGSTIFNTKITSKLFAVESTSNIYLRYEGKEWYQKFYPKTYSGNVTIPSGADAGLLNGNYSEYKSESHKPLLEKIAVVFNYNNYLADNKLSDFKFYISESMQKESSKYYFRIIKANSYFIMQNKEKGAITNLATMNNTLLIHQRYSLYIAAIKDRIVTLNEEIYLGVGNLLDRNPENVDIDDLGFAGCITKFAAIVTKYGYLFADKESYKVYLFNGKLIDISTSIKEYLREFFDYSISITDNPFFLNGCTMSFDSKYNRLLLTKIVKNTSINYDKSDTLSYCLERNIWVSKHDYLPACYVNNKKGLFLMDNVSGKVYQANNPLLTAEYFLNKKYPQYIDYVVNYDNANSYMLHTIAFNTECFNLKKNTIEFYETFNKIAIYNLYQCTNYIDVKKVLNLSTNENTSRNLDYLFKINNLRDLVINPKLGFLTSTHLFKDSNLKKIGLSFDKSRIFSKFVAVRLFNNNKDLKITLLDVKGLADKSLHK